MDLYALADLLIPLAGMSVGVLFASGIYRIIIRIIDAKGAGRAPQAELQALRAELAELRGDLGEQIGELHERLDFAERALAALPRGRGAGEDR